MCDKLTQETAIVRLRSQAFAQFVGVNVGVSARHSCTRQIKSTDYGACSTDSVSATKLTQAFEISSN